ncbi:Daunorubicin/doxorubicin resistance ATP-binding protein DrrA [Planctomycetes bacterium Poly30]|uniref:Daunorubicin/doxorubicin resistance ATP-binding protein DrrA n=1 Tax=Saltatorellus ferox TaxID=2528018 RepID=A0A518EUY6_9BACT|nr:Daunorubicin/doxorubicin resistance ATP-binding protein DrrA [Planctomycetes bacterium Poly30]
MNSTRSAPPSERALTPAAARTGLRSPGSISVRGLTQSFGDKVALAPLDLDIEPGGVIGLLGPNGSGKSTFMRLLVGLVPLQAGEIWVDGLRLEGDGVEIRQRTTYAPGELHLYGELRGRDQIAFLLRGRDRATRRRAEATAEGMGLPLDKRVRGYSHGMKRQLVFAAAMAPDVRIRILDEISEGLDPAKRSEVLDLIEADAKSGTTILLSSHHLGEVDRSCERLVFINAGKLIADETASSVSERAARIVRVTYPEGVNLDDVPRALGESVAESMRVEGRQLHVMLETDDPRAFLEALGANRSLPAPVAIEHGKLSLRELYRSLYGVEGT